jgi:hypothetical protein
MKIYFNIKTAALLVISGLTLLLGACTEDFDISLTTSYVGLVVDGQITTDTTSHKVILSKSGDPLNKLPREYVSNAIVTITDGTNTFNLSENPNQKGLYETLPNVYGVPGKTYELNISNVDINNDGVMETYSATSQLRKENPIDSIKILSQVFNTDNKGWAINMYSQDIGGDTRNYYLIKVSKNGTLLTDSLQESSIASNSGFEGKYYSGITVYFLNYNKFDEKVALGDTITLELDGITEDYYNFIDAYEKEFFPKDPIFSGPSANVPSNIKPKENATGFFAAYSVYRKSRIYR